MPINKSTIRSILLAASCFVPATAYAQAGPDTPAADAAAVDTPEITTPETVVVTGSLITRPGFQAPTPVTALGSEDIEKAAPTAIADILNTMPQFGSPTTSHAGFQGGNAGGANYINLRNLGTSRTLVLLNGERVVSSALTTAVDLNMLPTALLKRVDIVTGGASASYGSDAVAGVVNFVLDTNYEGLKASAQYSNNYQSAYEGYKTDIAVGTGFDGDRGHIVASFSYFDNPNFYLARQTTWNKNAVLMLNPVQGPGQPRLIHATGIGIWQQSAGGVIARNPNDPNAPPNPLANTIFVGPNAIPTAYDPGHISGVLSFGGDAEGAITSNMPVGLPQHAYNFYTYGEYHVTPNIKAHVELDYGADGGSSEIGPYQRAMNLPISIDNPFIPQATRDLMVANGLTSFMLGTNNANTGNAACDCVVYPNHRAQVRATAGLDGAVGDWSWNAYYTHGETHATEFWLNDIYIPYYNMAVDAVAAPVGNTLGVAPGTAVCRSTLTDPTNGCKPLNVFGVGAASAAAVNYVTPVPWTEVNNKQDVASVSIQGDPFSLWAGPVSFAGGAAYRSESAVSTSDPLTYTRKFAYGNALPFEGAVNVYEGYAETVVPLARDEWWAKSMDFNGAGRITEYSTSGLVETWKLGLTDQINDDFRLRATWSNDIRAPSLSELFTQAVSGGRAIADPFNPGTAPSVLATTKGNPDLKPEVALGVTGGIVLTPHWLPGFSASFDWYSITIKGAIGTVSAENELLYCFQGQTVYCPFIHRNAQGVLTEIESVPTNTAFERTSGLDVEMAYTTDLWDGVLNLHALANYTDEHTSVNASGQVTDNAGSMSNVTGGSGQPKFKATLAATYDFGPYSGTVQTRLLSSGRLLNTWTSLDVDDNTVPGMAYLDLRGSYNINDNWQAFFAVDNTLDTPPPSAPGPYNSASSYYTPASPGTVYDLFGRMYRVGLRVNF